MVQKTPLLHHYLKYWNYNKSRVIIPASLIWVVRCEFHCEVVCEHIVCLRLRQIDSFLQRLLYQQRHLEER